MRFFTCLLDPGGRGISDVERLAYESLPRARGLVFQWQSVGGVAVLTGWDEPYGDPLTAQHGGWIAVGIVRLDNRPDLELWADCEGGAVTDLELVLRVVARHGTRYIPQFLGDFAFVVWDGSTRTAVAACDAFAVQRLYYAERRGLFAFASRAEALALEERYEVQYLVELVAMQATSRDLSVYAGVRPVPPACIALLERTKLNIRQYWNAADFELEPAWVDSESKAIETCRRLLTESVRLRLGDVGETWAQLSGGIDSSSVVSLVQWLAQRGQIAHGLAGTITYVDRQGTSADEREYSNAVVNRWPARNETIVDSPMWYDDRFAPPYTDQPRSDLQFYPRDCRLCAVVRAAGGRVLLTGWGGDELFMGSMLFFADWLAQGRVWTAVREMARRAAIGRTSFWELAYKNALLPLLPRAVQSRLVHDDDYVVQPWLERATLRRYGLSTRSPMAPEYAGRVGRKYRHAVAKRMEVLASLTTHGVIEDSLSVRHPFLYRPLVEFALRLPPDLRARPYAHRWVVREAMRGIVPDTVRTRVGKPGGGEVLAGALTTQQALLAPLLREPILAELGVLDAAKLRAAFAVVPQRTNIKEYMHAQVLSTLAVEAWLQRRSGRWPRGGHLRSTESIA